MNKAKIIIAIFLTTINSDSYCQEWTLEKDKNGIKVYAREATDSQFAETRAISNFNTSKEKFIEFIWDIENYPNWQKDYIISKVLASKGKYNKTIYFEFKAPWPIQNRDIVIDMKQVEKDDATYAYTQVEKSILAPKDGIVRMSKYNGFWKIKELENGIEVILQMATNPEGKIPTFLIDFHKVTGPYNTFMNLKSIFN
tara:strand:- start:937 stop:1530 length:594 start_codon:yes stop_codon:yes gene_type:complete